MSLEDHTDSDRSDHEIAKATLRRTLLQQCVGRSNRRSGKDLATLTPVSESTVRDLLKELRAEGLPVVSLGNGYFVIETANEYEQVIESIDKDIQTRKKTKRELFEAVTE